MHQTDHEVLEQRAAPSPENPAVALNSLEAMERSNPGQARRVSELDAYSIDAVWAAVDLISGDIAKLPLELRQRQPEIGPRAHRKVEGALSRMVGFQPNPVLPASEFWRRVMTHVLIWGNAYVWFDRIAGELYHLLPDRTEIYWPSGMPLDEPRRLDYVYRSLINGQIEYFLPEEILHVNWLTAASQYWGMEGLRLTAAARRAWSLNLDQTDYESQFYARGGRVGGFLVVPPYTDKQTRDNLEREFGESYQGRGQAFKTGVIKENVKFHAAQRSPDEAKLNESKESSRYDVALRFGVPLERFGLGSNAYRSLTEANRAYIDHTLAPWFALITGQLDTKVLGFRRQTTQFFAFNTDSMVMADRPEQVDTLVKAVAGFLMTPNEARAELGLPAIEGGDELVNPSTTSSNASEPEPEPAEPEPAAGENGENRSRGRFNGRSLPLGS